MLSDFHIKSKLPLRRLHRVSAQCWRGRRRNVFLENFYAFRMTYFHMVTMCLDPLTPKFRG